MSKHAVSAEGGAMSAIGQLSRRAALGALASAPALAISTSAIAAPSPKLAALMEAHRAATEELERAITAEEAAEPADDTVVACANGKEWRAELGYEGVLGEIAEHFKGESLLTSLALQSLPIELRNAVASAREAERRACLARVNTVFVDFLAARRRREEASNAADEAIMAVCAHRCASLDDVAAKARLLALHIMNEPITDEMQAALIYSLIPEGDPLAA